MSASPHKSGEQKVESDLHVGNHRNLEQLDLAQQHDQEASPDSQGEQQVHEVGVGNIMQGHPATQEQASLYETDVKEQDRWLPIANVARIMKQALPDNAKIAKEAKECMQECVSEFISFITSEASEKCHAEKRKTVNGEDIIFAMTSLGFENYSEALRIYLVRYRETNLLKSDEKAANRPSSGVDASNNAATGLVGEPADIDEQDLDAGEESVLGGQPAFGGAQESESNGTPFSYPSHVGSNGSSY